MAKEAKVWEIIREAGYEPLENRCIVMSYAPDCEVSGSEYGIFRAADLPRGAGAGSLWKTGLGAEKRGYPGDSLFQNPGCGDEKGRAERLSDHPDRGGCDHAVHSAERTELPEKLRNSGRKLAWRKYG